MSNEPVVELEVEAPRTDPPGNRLRSAREAAGMSQSDVAVQLRLPLATIDALEHDRYDALPESIFVRGYLRSYTSLLGLAPDDVLERYDQSVGAPPQPHLHSQRMPSQVGSGHRRMRYASALIVVLLGALVAVWWYNNELLRPQPIPPQPPTATQAPESAGGKVPATGTAPPARTEPAPSASAPPSRQVAPAVPGAGGAGSTAAQSPATAAPQAPPSPPPAVTKPEAAAAQEDSSPTSAPDSSPATAPASPPAAETQPPASAPGAAAAKKPSQPATSGHSAANARDTLRLSFDGSSWVEVRDATGKRLLYRLSRKGDVETVTGKAPFQVLLGNSPVVAVQFNGQPFDQSAYNTHGNTARFEVGK